ncbi:MAG: MBL fold metallo-hydrolase [Candidatus Hodarchaeales archaeon]|jgi:glyoxylase-like metal-dependent hydrolase (beta-lactamase superfamily II)
MESTKPVQLMELRSITDDIWFIPNVVNIGVIRDTDNSVILIDTGIDRGIGKKILNLLSIEKLSLKAIINTHSHADHCGGNKYLQDTTDVTIYAPMIEDAIISHPYLEPWYLFSGATPIEDLQNKFLMAKPSKVDRVIENHERSLKFENAELNILPLPGHALNQIGIEYDSVCFCADSIFSEEVLEKHKVPFFTDIKKTLETLNYLLSTQFSFYVPAHAVPSPNISKVVRANINSIKRIEKFIFGILTQPMTTDQVIKSTADHFQLALTRVNQYFLLRTPVLAYLSYLRNQKMIDVKVSSNELIWYRAN